MTYPSHTIVWKRFSCLYSCISAVSPKWPLSNRDIPLIIPQPFVLPMESWLGIKGLQDLILPSPALPPHFHPELEVYVTIVHSSQTEGRFMSQGFCSSSLTYLENSALPPKHPTHIPILASCFSFARAWLSHRYSRKPSLTQPCCCHWAELCASPLWPRIPGFSLTQHLYSVVLESFSVCVC